MFNMWQWIETSSFFNSLPLDKCCGNLEWEHFLNVVYAHTQTHTKRRRIENYLRQFLASTSLIFLRTKMAMYGLNSSPKSALECLFATFLFLFVSFCNCMPNTRTNDKFEYFGKFNQIFYTNHELFAITRSIATFVAQSIFA